MAAWTPSDLTNPSFVATQLSGKDRSTALYTVNNELTSAKESLQAAARAQTVASEAANQGPSRGEINALKAKANNPSLSPTEREQASQQAAQLADQRDRLNVAAENALQKLNNANQYYENLEQGKNNLVAAGTVEPGVNLYAAPPGYEGRSAPAAQVPDSQNPGSTPATAAPELESASPELVDPTQDPVANLATGEEDVGFEPLQEPPGVTADEFDGIDQQVDDNENTLQEPPQLSDDEVDAYLQQGGESETITSPDSITENVFDPRQDVEENVFNPTQDVQESVFDPEAGGSGGYSGTTAKLNTQSQATQQDVANFKQKEDWRVRLSLAPGATYLYKDSSPGILAPLAATDGVIFPYTPSISVAYSAAYDPTELTHTNYKFFQYKSSSVDSVNLTCDFTAQDTFEANYLLAVIHFFRSVTKMFYGQDQNPKPGTPPPLCYLSGLGSFQFDAHPLAITGFTYSLPNDVDYIRAGSTTTNAGVSKAQSIPKINVSSASASRMDSSNLNAGGTQAPPKFASNAGTTEPTYVPTKMQISITAIPIVTRNDISNKFSLKEYATGKLLRGTQRSGGGIW
jgi:hypothetical protein